MGTPAGTFPTRSGSTVKRETAEDTNARARAQDDLAVLIRQMNDAGCTCDEHCWHVSRAGISLRHRQSCPARPVVGDLFSKTTATGVQARAAGPHDSTWRTTRRCGAPTKRGARCRQKLGPDEPCKFHGPRPEADQPDTTDTKER